MSLPSLQFPPTSWPGGRYSFLLAALVLMFAVDPFVHNSLFGRIVLDAFMVLVFLSGALALGNRSITWAIALCLLVPELLGIVLGWLDTQGSLGSGAGGIIRVTAAMAFFGYLTGVISADLFQDKQVSADTICGALCVYLMLGLLWALGYLLIANFVPGSFVVDGEVLKVRSAEDGHRVFMLMIYFSFVTLTTLGYGDILPKGPIAQTAAWLEAITGAIFLATFVAGLVGLHIAKRIEEQRESKDSGN